MRPKGGPMLLSDFGEARIGPGPHGGDIMPLEYRAPETLLYVGWSYPVDIWSVGLTVSVFIRCTHFTVPRNQLTNSNSEKAWDLLEPKRLFTARRDDDGDLYDAAHLAQLIAALGPPPVEFLAKNPERRADFWDDEGMHSALDCGYTQLYDYGFMFHTNLYRFREMAGSCTHTGSSDNGSS